MDEMFKNVMYHMWLRSPSCWKVNNNASLHKSNLIFMLFVIFINLCHGDYSLHYFRSKIQHCFENAPKNWNTYIRMFIYRYLNHNNFQKKYAIFNYFTFINIQYHSWN